jgi:membrane protease YdiL (CAAX protease family)
MTEQSAIDEAFGTEPPVQLEAFEQWLEPARPKIQLWRTLVGLVIIVVVSQVFALVVALGFALFALTRNSGMEGVQQMVEEISAGSTIVGTIAALLTFAGLWLGVWVALRALHGKQEFFSLFSPERRIRWREFGIGAGIMVIYLLISTLIGMAMGGDSGRRNDIDIPTWLMVLAPMAVLVFIQSTGEELVFRGYLMQHLAARFPHPLVWGFLPAATFGAIHWFNGTTVEYSVFYVLDTTLFGLIAAVTVWRTGSIAVAMGIHTINNLAGFMIAGTDDFLTATPLYLDTVDNALKAAPVGIVGMVLLLAFVMSPWAPMPKRQLFQRRKDTRAAP